MSDSDKAHQMKGSRVLHEDSNMIFRNYVKLSNFLTWTLTKFGSEGKVKVDIFPHFGARFGSSSPNEKELYRANA